jgi:hypothetical protein
MSLAGIVGLDELSMYFYDNSAIGDGPFSHSRLLLYKMPLEDINHAEKFGLHIKLYAPLERNCTENNY